MLFKTHLAVGIFAIILFLPLVSNPLGFAIIALIASALPDIDTPFSKFGRNKASKTVQIFTEHRGMFHSITICFLLTLILSFFIPKLAFGFFLGYSIHLLVDGFTKAGITPFWPYSRKAKGMLKVGGVAEKAIFVTFVVVDFLFLLIYLI